jgi:XTP/dITP diphosphohydrolase
VQYPRKLLIATGNPKKRTEMAQILSAAGLDIELLTLEDFPDAPEVEETGDTFVANATLKAVAAQQHSGLVAIADDGGLSIDALGGEPGVQSRYYLGDETPFPVKMTHLLERLNEVPDEQRTCRFTSAVVIALPEGDPIVCVGICEGRIGYEMRGEFGFGYDPIFVLPELGKHMAELRPEEKHRISHRGKSLACAVEHLRRIFPSAG